MLSSSARLGGVARATLVRRGSYTRDTGGAQVLGTPVPSFAHFPYKYREILYLYKEFLKLIHYHHPPEERRDLLFRLRNEFQSKRHLSGRKVISAAVRRGEGILALQKQILDRDESRRRRLQMAAGGSRESRVGRRRDGAADMAAAGGADSVDALWEQLQHVSNNVLPGLNNSRSVDISGGTSYVNQATTQNVYSRRR